MKMKIRLIAIRQNHRQLLPLLSTGRNFTIKRPCSNIHQIECEQVKSTQQNTTADTDDIKYEESIKEKILENALGYVDKSGWSIESLAAGAEEAGYPGVTHGLFPNGGGDLIDYFNLKCNAELVAMMKDWPNKAVDDRTTPTKFVEDAIVARLLMIQPYKNTWAKAMATQALPGNVPKCLAALLSLVDDICYHSGDRSVDINWYIRRVGLAGIYKASELYYLTDNTENNVGTRHFVASRIKEALVIQNALNINPASSAPQALTAAFVTAKNILGLNSISK